jgi:periodic tryptophan protein 2
MKFNYKLRRVCGAAYGYPVTASNVSASAATQWSGSNVIFASHTTSKTNGKDDVLIAAVGNRIQMTHLQNVTVTSLPIEARSNIVVLAHAAPFVLAIDVQNYGLWVHLYKGIVVHRFRLPHRVRCATVSPNGQWVAIGTGSHVQVWSTPLYSLQSDPNGLSSFAPLQLHRTFTGLGGDVTTIQWSTDGSVIAAASKDGSARVWTVSTVRNYVPVNLAGHKTALVGLYFATETTSAILSACSMYTISTDGAVVTWDCQRRPAEDALNVTMDDGNDDNVAMDETDTNDNELSIQTALHDSNTIPTVAADMAHQLVNCQWSVQQRHYLNAGGTSSSTGNLGSVTCTSMANGIMAVGYGSGVVGLYEMPGVIQLHTLAVSGNGSLIKACTLHPSGDWLALAAPVAQMLAVWEWRSESYVLRQRGHGAGGLTTMAYAPDAVAVATGGLDGTLKVWNASTGLCYVTFSEAASQHTAAITAVAFAKPSVVVTASLDGTVKLHDLHRYRTFKTLTTPTPVQLVSMAIDAAGEVVVAANNSDPFHIYAWSVQTGKLLDVLSGHAGPIGDLKFQPGTGILCSASWDGTVKTWDLYKNSGMATDSFQHLTDVVCVAIAPDGKQICSGTIGGLLSFWNVESSKLQFEIDGRLDIVGGRKHNDRMTADNNAASRYFTSVCYSADGSCVLAGGNSKFVCIYEVSQQILIKKFQVSFNRSLDGVLDEVRTLPVRAVTVYGAWTRASIMSAKNRPQRNDDELPINIRSKALTVETPVESNVTSLDV